MKLPLGQLFFCNVDWTGPNRWSTTLGEPAKYFSECFSGIGLNWLTCSDFFWLMVVEETKLGVKVLGIRNIGGFKIYFLTKGTERYRKFEKLRIAYLNKHKKFIFDEDELC